MPECVTPTFRSGRFSVMVWGAIAYELKSNLIIFPEGPVRSSIYNDLILNGELKRFKNRVCIYSSIASPPVRIVEDNAPIHTAKLCKRTRAALGFQFLKWCPVSPDLNPIEHVWALLKRRMKRFPKATSRAMLIRQINLLWRELAPKDFNHAIRSMPRRCAEIIEKGGYPIHYYGFCI